MLVKELIKELQKMPQDVAVLFVTEEGMDDVFSPIAASSMLRTTYPDGYSEIIDPEEIDREEDDDFNDIVVVSLDWA